jgi:hypothetical protein
MKKKIQILYDIVEPKSQQILRWQSYSERGIVGVCMEDVATMSKSYYL